MEKKYINPDTLMTPRGFTQVVTIAGASKMVFISGQVAVDKEGKLVGPNDLKAQIRQALEQRGSDLGPFAYEHQRLGVTQALGQGIDVLDVVVPNRDVVTGQLAEAIERANRVEVIVQD